MATVLAHESELRFELGGPAYRLMQRVGLIVGEGPSVGRRIVAFLLITWFPLLVFSLLEGRAIGATPRGSFLLDFAGVERDRRVADAFEAFGAFHTNAQAPEWLSAGGNKEDGVVLGLRGGRSGRWLLLGRAGSCGRLGGGGLCECWRRAGGQNGKW